MGLPSIKIPAGFLTVLLLTTTIGGCGGDHDQPYAPTDLAISSTVSLNKLSWSTVPWEDYNIYRGTASGAETAIATVHADFDATTFIDMPAPSSTTPYYYFVTALDADGNESSSSNEVSVTPPVLAPGIVTPASGALSWTMPASFSGVTNYNIYRSGASGLENLPVLASSTTTSYNDATVVHGTTFYYRVTALGPSGETLGSNEISATP